MENLKGIKIISDRSINKVRTMEFVVIEQQEKLAIDSLILCIDAGAEVTLTDDRNKREGTVSIKIENGAYLKCSGGHGFSIDWNITNLKDVLWLIKETIAFNVGSNNGRIKIGKF